MPGIETLNTYVSDVTALTSGTFSSSQSNRIRQADSGSKVRLVGLWSKGTVVAPVRIISPRMHDDVQGLRMETPAANARDILVRGIETALVSNDQIEVDSYDTATTNRNTLLQVYYDSIQGSNGNFSTWDQIKPRIMDLIGVSLPVSAAATLSEWSAGDSWDVSTNLMKADADYAVLGYTLATAVAGIALAGPATGNMKFGGPGTGDVIHTRDYFVRLSSESGLASIPVIRQADRGNTYVYQVDNLAGASNTVTFLCARLSA